MPWVQFTSGRGPIECALACYGISKRVINEAQALGCQVATLEETLGPVPNTALSVVLDIQGTNALAFVKRIEGQMQWVCKSPCRPGHKRKNWFIGVAIIPEPESSILNLADVKFDTMCSTGPGGQHVNKTESAVRATHVPTGLVAIARDQRSQHQNKALAIKRLLRAFTQKQQKLSKTCEQERWQEHNVLIRGNPVRTYIGEKFKRTC